MSDDRQFLHNQLIKLGDMMGSGLHHEEPWIEKEYGKIYRKLYPEDFRERQQKLNKHRDKLVAEKLKTTTCNACKGPLRQSRSGSYVVKCLRCGKRWRFKVKKKGK